MSEMSDPQRTEILQKHGFTQYTTPEGRIYYHNAKTNQSVWALPQEVQDELDELSKPEKKVESSTSTTNIDIAKYLPPQLPMRTRDDDTEFLAMLKENQVDATWSFNTVIETLIKDKRYWSISDPLRKQRVFEDYLQNRSREELLKENNSLEKFQDAFIGVLKSHGVSYLSRWVTVRQRIADEPIYKHSVISEKIKRQTFERYVNSLREQRDAVQGELKNKAVQELNDYMKSLNFINLQTNWNDVLDYIKPDKRFEQNKHFQVLNQLDLLKSYEMIIKDLQLAQLEKIKTLKIRNYRNDRKKRDAYIGRLNQLRDEGKISASTKWGDIYPLIKEDPAFLDLLGRNGSNPYELFQQIIKKEELVIIAKKAVVEQLLIHNGIEIDISETIDHKKQFAKIQEFLRKDKETAGYDDITLGLIYDKLIEDTRENKRLEEIERQQKLLRDKERFRAFLHRFADPPIKRDSKWEDYIPKFDEADLQSLPENIRHEIFDEYLEYLTKREKELEMQRELDLKKMIEEATAAAPGLPSRKKMVTQVVEPEEELDY